MSKTRYRGVLMQKIISNLYVIGLMVVGCMSSQEQNSTGTTATGIMAPL
jgi:uncharacterized protein YcfL